MLEKWRKSQWNMKIFNRTSPHTHTSIQSKSCYGQNSNKSHIYYKYLGVSEWCRSHCICRCHFYYHSKEFTKALIFCFSKLFSSVLDFAQHPNIRPDFESDLCIRFIVVSIYIYISIWIPNIDSTDPLIFRELNRSKPFSIRYL